jgi:DNA-binding NarL/FixJ family response regulator
VWLAVRELPWPAGHTNTENGNEGRRMTTFTERQLKIIALVAQGHSASKVAGMLNPVVKEPTVRMEIRFIADKIPGDSRPVVKIMRWFYSQQRAA